MAYQWLFGSLLFLSAWAVLFVINPSLRKEMFFVSALTAPFGLVQALFVPSYWDPPSFFGFGGAIGFDLESIIFSFAIGGIAAVIHKSISRVSHRDGDSELRPGLHALAISSPFVSGALLFLFTEANPIYISSTALLVGGLSISISRPDLIKSILFGAVLFTALYFSLFQIILHLFPDFVDMWNLPAISGILVAGVPIEELIFAFAYGSMWSGFYDHLMHRRPVL